MEFLLYLSTQGRDVYNLISQKVRVVENTAICRKYDIFGWYQSNQNTMTICTDKIKSIGNPEYYVNETLFHESVHIAQSCKSKNEELVPFGISKNLMYLNENRKKDVLNAIKISGYKVKQIEHEAHWMEDKPEKVNYVLKKYCF